MQHNCGKNEATKGDKMHCPTCHAQDTKVIETRILQNGMAVRRRRRCEECDKRFTTYENVNIQLPAVVKADGRRENFNREKIVKGLSKACQKRPISTDQIHSLIDGLEKRLSELSLKEVAADFIGNYVMEELYRMDSVSYVRFASFYWEFDNISDFITNLENIHKGPIINRDHLYKKGQLSEQPTNQ